MVLAVLGLGLSTVQASAPIKKSTRFENLTITPIAVYANDIVNCSATLYYQNKNGKYGPLSYKNVQVEWRIDGQPVSVTPTSKGVATYSFQVPANARKGTHHVEVKFYGDIELKPCWMTRSFTVLR